MASEGTTDRQSTDLVHEAISLVSLFETEGDARHILAAYGAIWRAEKERERDAREAESVTGPAAEALFERTRRRVLAAMAAHVEAELGTLERIDARQPKTVPRAVAAFRDRRIVECIQAEYGAIRVQQMAWLKGRRRTLPVSAVKVRVRERIAQRVGTSASAVLRALTDLVGPADQRRERLARLSGSRESGAQFDRRRRALIRLIDEVEENAKTIRVRRTAAKKPNASAQRRPSPLDFSRKRTRGKK